MNKSNRKGKVLYLCLQVTKEGQASYAHVHEIIHGLRHRGWQVNLYEPRYRSFSGQVGTANRLLEFAFTQLRFLFSRRPEVLYIRWHFGAFPTACWARLRGIPVVQEVNGTYEDLFIAWPWTRKLRRLFEWLMRIQLCWAQQVIAVTPGLAEWVKQETNHERVDVVSNGANIKLFNPKTDVDSALVSHRPYALFFGALAPWQGIDTILAAVVHQAWPTDMKLVIVGDGMERSKVEAARIHSSRIVYMEVQSYQRMPSIIKGSLAILSPQKGIRSEYGLMPLKVFEALACAVPVVLSDYPGMADLVRVARCGIVVNPDDQEALAKAVAYLYHHPENREAMGKRGREVIEKNHSWDQKSALTSRILNRVLRGV